MKKDSLSVSVLMAIASTLFLANSAVAQPKITNCDITPKEIAFKDKVTMSFDFEGVDGGLSTAKVKLTQKFIFPGDEKPVERTSNWQVYLENLSAYASESGKFKKEFTNADIWRGPIVELTYEFKIVDRNGKESVACSTKIKPKK